MSNRTMQSDSKGLRACWHVPARHRCLHAAAERHLPTRSRLGPVVIRGIPSTAPASAELRSPIWQAFRTAPSSRPLDKLNAGPMQAGDHGDLGFQPDPAEEAGRDFRQHLAAGRPDRPRSSPPRAYGRHRSISVRDPSRASGQRSLLLSDPFPAAALRSASNAKTGDKDDLATDTRIATTVNVRPGFVVRFGVPFGSVQPTNTCPVPDGSRTRSFPRPTHSPSRSS